MRIVWSDDFFLNTMSYSKENVKFWRCVVVDVGKGMGYDFFMTDFSQKHHRRSIRLKGYDYSQAGAYFVTICTQNRAEIFGEIRNGEMALSEAGKMIDHWWNVLPSKFSNVILDAFVIMPDHMHGILVIDDEVNVGADQRVCPNVQKIPDQCVCLDTKYGECVDFDMYQCEQRGYFDVPQGEHAGSPVRREFQGEHIGSPQRGSPVRIEGNDGIPKMIQWFKTMTTNEYIRHVKTDGWERFDGKMWQRNYYERIIRNDEELWNVQEYIRKNPMKWGIPDDEDVISFETD